MSVVFSHTLSRLFALLDSLQVLGEPMLRKPERARWFEMLLFFRCSRRQRVAWARQRSWQRDTDFLSSALVVSVKDPRGLSKRPRAEVGGRGERAKARALLSGGRGADDTRPAVQRARFRRGDEDEISVAASCAAGEIRRHVGRKIALSKRPMAAD